MSGIILRKHQNDVVTDTDLAWIHVDNILAVLPTGAGKTFVMGELARRCYANNEVCFIFAHRDVLISQLSKSLCMMGVHHSFIASKKSIGNTTNNNVAKFGDSFHQESSPVIIISVDTFINKIKEPHYFQALLDRCKLWMMDEAHHVLAENKWGKCVDPLVNAKGLGVTATPLRADKKGLGSHAHGVFNHMVVGATQSELMELGHLSLYKIYAPPTKLNVEGMRVTNSGDWNQTTLAKRTDNSDITGDAVQHYLKYANGLQAIGFCVNIAHSEHVAKEFNAAGIPSIALSSKTPTPVLLKALDDFENGVYKILFNCDLFGEGFDVPAVSAVIMLRKTESYSLFKQQFGRCLRPYEGKIYGILLDHVGNVKRHCVHGNSPHDDPEWTLDALINSNDDGERSNTRICPECFFAYEPTVRFRYVCPDCAHEETNEEINQAEQDFQHEEGELVELEVDFVNKLMLEKNKVDLDPDIFRNRMVNAPAMIRNSATNNHIKRQNAQTLLRHEIQNWCVNTAGQQWDKKTVHGMFHIEFGINIYKAQVLSERLALELMNKIRENLK